MFELLRRRQLKEKYAALWLVVGLGVLVLVIAPGRLTTVSEALGFEAPSNFLFFIALTLLLGVTVHLSWSSHGWRRRPRAGGGDRHRQHAVGRGGSGRRPGP